jgi:(2Fe-2S) ferredoxin
VYLFLVVLVCVFACMLGPDVCVMLEGARYKSFED